MSSSPNQRPLPLPPTQDAELVITITPELVRAVANRVYALWLRELKLTRERRRRH